MLTGNLSPCKFIRCRRKLMRGFTLIELVAVMVILSIVGTIGVGFVVRSTEAYQRTQTRALLVNTARQALERMTRQLRGALPYSVRITNGGNCIEFMPIAAGGNYFSPVPDQENNAAAQSAIVAAPVTIDFGTAHFVAIGAMAADELYGADPESLEGYSGISSGAIQLTAEKQWLRNSINKRFYLLDNAQAFCVDAGELRFFYDIDPLNNDVDLAAASDILARNIDADTPFTLAVGTDNRNTRVDISLDFSIGGETINYTQGVLIRNVP